MKEISATILDQEYSCTYYFFKMNQRKTTPIQFGFIWINWVEDIYAI
jgi:hypothetical protein